MPNAVAPQQVVPSIKKFIEMRAGKSTGAIMTGRSSHPYKISYGGANFRCARGNGRSPPPSPKVTDGSCPAGPKATILYLFTTTSLGEEVYPAFGVDNLVQGTFINVDKGGLLTPCQFAPHCEAYDDVELLRWNMNFTFHMNNLTPISPDETGEIVVSRFKYI